MKIWSHRPANRGLIQCLAASCLLFPATLSLLAQNPDDGERSTSIAAPTMEERIFQLEQSQSQLLEQNRQLSSQVRILSDQSRQPMALESSPGRSTLPPSPDSSATTNDEPALFNQYGVAPDNVFPLSPFDSAAEFPLERSPSIVDSSMGSRQYFAGYDRGFVIRPMDKNESPFELKISSQAQFRYVGFDRNVPTWTDSAGNMSPVSDISSFQVPRGRIIFSGFALRPELLYNLNIDYNTVSSSQVNFRAYWLAWRFSRAMTIYAGQSKVPGSREWLSSFVNTLGVDRSMATTFFRPSLSQGLWATGEPTDGLFYHVMMSNGFNTLGTTPDKLNTRMAFSGSVWWEPWGEFGPGYYDFEWHEAPAIRIGTSGTYSPEQGPQGNPNLPENVDLRFSDGTLITQTGALAPGVTLNTYTIGLTAFDFAYKHRGIGISGELYLQDLFGLGGDGPIPRSSVFQYGGFAQAGYFVVPQKLEPYTRYSQVNGPFGTGSEYAGGFNWFFLPGKQNLRFTLDAAWLEHNPADQNRTNYQAGQSGLLVRSQIQIYF